MPMTLHELSFYRQNDINTLLLKLTIKAVSTAPLILSELTILVRACERDGVL